VVGRNTQGVTIIKPDKDEKVIGVDRIEGLAGVDDTDDDLLDDAESELDVSEETTNDDSEPGEES
jgi:DNA gyrase subunit A